MWRKLRTWTSGCQIGRAELPTAAAGTRIVRMLKPGQQMRVNLAGMQIGSVVFHAAVTEPWVLSSARFPRLPRSTW